MGKKFKYVGDGLGVSGLPHEIEDEGLHPAVKEELHKAIEAGLYEEVKDASAAPVKKKPAQDKPSARVDIPERDDKE